ncbi:uncharacterized protein [Triticum aestivum]|uniref:uncharacterized protein n=1 Tax=Triticum aestivum TaxID=4565 RepID=UPI001D0113CD|nr:uncharacterized protein LOC123051537 [Triticum aestivum]
MEECGHGTWELRCPATVSDGGVRTRDELCYSGDGLTWRSSAGPAACVGGCCAGPAAPALLHHRKGLLFFRRRHGPSRRNWAAGARGDQRGSPSSPCAAVALSLHLRAWRQRRRCACAQQKDGAASSFGGGFDSGEDKEAATHGAARSDDASTTRAIWARLHPLQRPVLPTTIASCREPELPLLPPRSYCCSSPRQANLLPLLPLAPLPSMRCC